MDSYPHVSLGPIIGVLIWLALRHANRPSPKPLRHASMLSVDHPESCINATAKSEQEGIQDMRRLVIGPPLENAWVFAQGKSPGDSQWFEVGVNKTAESIGYDEDSLRTIMREHNDIAIYHIHPDCYKGPHDAVIMSLTMPSGADICSMILCSMAFRKYHRKGKIRHKVCSAYGVSEYYLTEMGYKFYGGMNRAPDTASLVKIQSAFEKKKHESILLFLRNGISLSSHAIDIMARMLSDDKIQIAFTKHREMSI